MKKHIALIIALIFVLSLAGCSEHQQNGGDTSPNHAETAADIPEHPLTITANDKSIYPYLHFAYSGQWNGNGFLCADGVDLTSELAELEANGLIPQLYYAEDFNVILGNNVTAQHILLYDNKFNQLENLWDISDISELDEGDYYVGIVVNRQGKYIEEVKQNEYDGWACVFRLIIGE